AVRCAFSVFSASTSTSLEASCSPASHSRLRGKRRRDTYLTTSYPDGHVGIPLIKATRVPFSSSRFELVATAAVGWFLGFKATPEQNRPHDLLASPWFALALKSFPRGQRSRVSGITTYV